MMLKGKGQKPADKTTDRIRLKGDESGGRNALGGRVGWKRVHSFPDLT